MITAENIFIQHDQKVRTKIQTIQETGLIDTDHQWFDLTLEDRQEIEMIVGYLKGVTVDDAMQALINLGNDRAIQGIAIDGNWEEVASNLDVRYPYERPLIQLAIYLVASYLRTKFSKEKRNITTPLSRIVGKKSGKTVEKE